jgi:phosphoglycerate dehydrogenase-like enzyme
MKVAILDDDNILATPHIGYVTEDIDRTFYGDAAAKIASWLERQASLIQLWPVCILSPPSE